MFNELEDDVTYDVVIAAILTVYEPTSEAYRKNFRSKVNSDSETYTSYAYILNCLFKRLVKSRNGYNDLELLKEIVLNERFFLFPAG